MAFMDFTITNGILTAYHGTDTDVVIPTGVKEIGAKSAGLEVLDLWVSGDSLGREERWVNCLARKMR